MGWALLRRRGVVEGRLGEGGGVCLCIIGAFGGFGELWGVDRWVSARILSRCEAWRWEGIGGD